MRNRIVFAVAGLAVLAGAGLLLGLWLSWHAPVKPIEEPVQLSAQGRPGEAPVAAVDASTYLPEPPQPRMDGTRGVPARRVAPQNAIPMVSAADDPQPDTLISTIIPDLEALQEQYNPQSSLPALPIQQQPLPQVATVTAGGLGQADGSAPANGRVPVLGEEAWIVRLRDDIAQCAAQGVVSRGMCMEQARWKHCGPNAGWGKIPECPQTGNN